MASRRGNKRLVHITEYHVHDFDLGTIVVHKVDFLMSINSMSFYRRVLQIRNKGSRIYFFYITLRAGETERNVPYGLTSAKSKILHFSSINY